MQGAHRLVVLRDQLHDGGAVQRSRVLALPARVKPAVRAEALPLEKSAAIYRSLSSNNGSLNVEK